MNVYPVFIYIEKIFEKETEIVKEIVEVLKYAGKRRKNAEK